MYLTHNDMTLGGFVGPATIEAGAYGEEETGFAEQPAKKTCPGNSGARGSSADSCLITV